MAVSYKKLWKLLIDRDMKKKDLAVIADISNYTVTKMSKGENVTVETLGKICAQHAPRYCAQAPHHRSLDRLCIREFYRRRGVCASRRF